MTVKEYFDSIIKKLKLDETADIDEQTNEPEPEPKPEPEKKKEPDSSAVELLQKLLSENAELKKMNAKLAKQTSVTTPNKPDGKEPDVEELIYKLVTPTEGKENG